MSGEGFVADMPPYLTTAKCHRCKVYTYSV